MQLYRPHHKMRAGLCRRFSCDYARSTIHDTRPTQTAIIPHTTRWSTSQRRSASSTYQIPAATPRRCTAQHRPPIIIMYIRVQGCAACYGSMPDGATYRRPYQPGGVSSYRLRIAGKRYTQRVSPAAGARRAARNHWRLSPHLFSGFRPIANRGQQ